MLGLGVAHSDHPGIPNLGYLACVLLLTALELTIHAALRANT